MIDPAKSKMRSFAALAAAFLAVAALGACSRGETLLTVNASATTRTTPDLAIVTLGVVARGPSARVAQEAQATRMSAVMEAARAAGVEEADVQTVGFSLEPQYTYPRGGTPRIGSYLSRNTISLRVKNLNAVSALIDATVAEGANELQGIQFTFQDTEASQNAARAQAVANARARATAYAEAADMRVARVLSITEPGGVVPPWDVSPRYDGLMSRVVAAEQSANAPISPGQVDNQSSVTVVFELR
ncbi:MAG: SIMPL domain-containing protein [Terricaulis sp.]